MSPEQTARLTYLKRLVALRIDEHTEGDVPNAPGGDIDIELANAARSVIKRSSRTGVLQLGKQAQNPVLVDSGRDSTIIPLPSDYLRFLQIDGKGYKQPVTTLLQADSRTYQEQIYTMKRATVANPLGFMIPYHTQNGNRAIELYPGVTQLAPQGLMYVPEIPAYDLPVEFEDALVWRATLAMLVILRSPSATSVLGLSESAIAEIGSEAAV